MTNEELIDAVTDHQIDLQHYANGVVREEVGRLNDGDEMLFAMLAAALLALPAGASPDQIDAALASSMMFNDRVYGAIGENLSGELLDVLRAELDFQASLMSESNPQPVDAGPTFRQASETPIQGETWLKSLLVLAAARGALIRRTVQGGFVAAQSVDQTLRALRGTKSAAYSDGLLNAARSNLETVIRSAVAHFAEYASATFYALNENLVQSLIWLSVLDGRTSPPCIARAGKRYMADAEHRPIGHSLSWGAGPGRYHYNCRSTFAPLVRGEVPTDNRFEDWLRRQPVARQDEVLGKSRGALYRSGSLPVDRFVNNRGRFITIDQMRRKF